MFFICHERLSPASFGFVCSLGGESWDGKEKGEIEEERVGTVVIC